MTTKNEKKIKNEKIQKTREKMRHRGVERKIEKRKTLGTHKNTKIQPSKTRSGGFFKIIADDIPRKHQGGGKTNENQMKQLKKKQILGKIKMNRGHNTKEQNGNTQTTS